MGTPGVGSHCRVSDLAVGSTEVTLLRDSRLPVVTRLTAGRCGLLGVLASMVLASALARAQSGSTGTSVLVARVEGMIDLGLVPFVERVLKEAEAAGAAAVILEVNTFGGRVDAAVGIRDHLLRSQITTVAFVNKRAISAGALITLATEKIVMASGGTIGAATPVQLGQPGEPAKPVEEKTLSYMRKEFRATADARNRPGSMAEAMVDPDVVIEGVIEKGKLLTLTTEEALSHKIADSTADDLTEVLAKLGLAGAQLRRVKQNWAETVVRFLTHPIVSSLLMTLAFLGIIVEIRTPGFGVPGLIGVLCLVAFFWGHFLVRLVGWEEVLLVALGVTLLAVELFVLPGFGVAGVLGILSLLAGLTLSLFGSGASLTSVVTALARVLISAAVALAGALLAMRLLPQLRVGRMLVLTTELGGKEYPDHPAEGAGLLGATGVSLTPLRPAGIAELAGRRVDVISQGEFIEAGQAVEVVEEAGHRVVVRSRRPKPPTEGAK
jgi:membrane-bound serine protease (ClpP class)